MGLAASQARFLAITSRKANCEFNSMKIAQEKLSITRQLASATQEYQNSLSKTKLVWDLDGSSGTAANSGQTYDLSYDVMMTPSALNGYDPYYVTDRSGKIVLNSRMAAAAKAAGISPDGTTKPNNIDGADNSPSPYKRFLTQLGVQGYLASSQVATLQSDKVYYNSKAGIGGEPIDKTQANAMTLSTMINYINKQAKADKEYAKKVNIDTSDSTIYLNSSRQTGEAGSSISLTDLLTKNITLVNSDSKTAQKQATDIATAMMDAMQDLFAKDAASNEAFIYARGEVNKLLDSSTSPRPYDMGSSKNPESVVAEYSSDYNTWVQSSGTYGISMSNVMKSFLTMYAQAIGNYNTDYKINDSKSESSYVTNDPNYYYILKNDSAVTEKDLLVADFYSNMFNNICTNGWTTSSGNVDDKEYLSHAIKNGQLFISSMSTDYHYYQDPYTLNGHVMEITDEDGIAQAEAEYNKQKSVLNYKEERLEVDMKNIDTELSALTTEYDSVKNLISKNVEKVFTMFSS